MKLLAFATAREQAGFSEVELPVEPAETPRAIIARAAPGLELDNLRVAVDCEFWDWDAPVGNAAELALIPPVSGG